MRFTPSSNWASIAKSAGVDIRWRLYLKKTTALNDALGSGTWVEVTDKLAEWPEISTAIEMETGQFTADEVMFVGLNRAWWNANIFDATAYIEGKVILDIGRGGTLATDSPVIFAGFVRKNPTVNEDDDTVEFALATPETLAEQMSAELITTQYIDDDIDGSGTDGLILPTIENLFIKDANISSYILQTGVHVITYEYNGGSRQAKLDDGLFVALTGSGNYTLGNGATTALDTQRVQVYVKTSQNALPAVDAEAKIVVTTPGTTLPNQFYFGNHALPLLKIIFAAMGIDTVTAGALEYGSWDSNARLTIVDQPPQTGNIVGYKYAMANDGTDLWIGVGNKLYKRTMSTHTYTLKATLNSGDRIDKILYASGNAEMWMWVRTSGGAAQARKFTIGSSTLSSAITTTGGDRDSFQILDYSGSGDAEYCGLYVDNSNKYIKRIDGSTLAVTTLFTNTDLGYSGSYGPHLGFSYMRNVLNYGCLIGKSGGEAILEIRWDPTNGIWENDGEVCTARPDSYSLAGFHASEDRIYYWDSVNFKVRKHARTSTSGTDVLTLSSNDTVFEFGYVSSYIYFSTCEKYSGGGLEAAKIYKVNNSAATMINETPAIFTKYFTWTGISSTIYGIDQYGRLFQYGSTLATFVQDADFDGKTVRDAFNEILIAFNLQATISAKRGFLYKRGSDAGAIQTTGNSITIIKTNAGRPLVRVTEFQPAMAIVILSNGARTNSYNGTAFDQNVATDAARLEISNEYMPSEILKDLAYRYYQFFKTKRDAITLPVLDVAVEFEPLDGATLTGFDEVSSATGMIARQLIRPDGTTELDIITPLG